jgi:hypothetical protein
MDDRDLSENTYFDILCLEARDRHWSRGLFEELVLIDQ